MAIEAYRIGVHLAMTNGVSPILSTIARDLLGVDSKIDQTAENFGRLKTAIAGAGMALAGGAMLKGMAALVNSGAELVHQQERMRNMGLSNLDVARATAAAWKATGQNLDSSVVENMKSIGDLRYVMGDLGEAMKALPAFTNMATVLSAAGLGSAKDEIFSAVKAMEQSGGLVDPKTHKIDPARALGLMDLMTKVDIATNGRVDPREMLNFTKMAGPAVSMMSPEAMYGTIPSIIQAMGGYRAGTAIQALTRQFTGGVMAQRTATELEGLGLLDKSKVTIGPGGHITMAAGAVIGLDTMQKDPVAWVRDTLMPALVSHGYNTPDKMIAESYRFLGTGPEVRLISDIIRNTPAILKDAAMISTAVGSQKGASNLLANDLDTEKSAFGKQVEGLMQSLGSPLVPIATAALLHINEGINYMTQTFAAHPEAVKVIGVTLTAFAGALVLVGTALVGMAIAPILALPATLAGITAGLVELATFFGLGMGGIQGPTAAGHWEILGRGGRRWIPETFGPPAPPKAGGSGGGSHIYMDGKKVGEIVGDHLGNAARMPTRGHSSFDGSFHPMSVLGNGP